MKDCQDPSLCCYAVACRLMLKLHGSICYTEQSQRVQGEMSVTSLTWDPVQSSEQCI